MYAQDSPEAEANLAAIELRLAELDGLFQTFSHGVYPGAHKLEELGMTAFGEMARRLNVAPYPHMLKWTRD